MQKSIVSLDSDKTKVRAKSVNMHLSVTQLCQHIHV